MKRASNLFDRICNIQNLHEAYYKAAKSKQLAKEVILFNKNYEQNLEKLRRSLIKKNLQTRKISPFYDYRSKGKDYKRGTICGQDCPPCNHKHFRACF